MCELELKKCLSEPPIAVFDSLKHLDAAANAHLNRNYARACELIKQANSDMTRAWTESLWGANSPYVRPRAVKNPLLQLAKAERIPIRMPNKATSQYLIERDGYNCRVCGVPLIRKEIREYFAKCYPELQIWGNSNRLQHAGFQAVWLQFDHVIPHSRGGNNEIENIIVTCAPCNYSRMSYTFEEIGLEDPRARPPMKTAWDGLERVLKSNPK